MYEDDEADQAELMAVRPPRDPIAIAGAAIVLGLAAETALDVWMRWDQIGIPTAADRLRLLATVMGPYPSTALLIGIALIRLREWLGVDRSALDDRYTRTAAGFGFAIALVFVIGSVAAALDVVLNSLGEVDELTARLQYAGRYAIGAAIAAAAAWLAMSDAAREPAPMGPGPDDDYDPGDFDPETFRPFATE